MTQPQAYPKGVELFQQGSLLQEVFYLQNGLVKLVYLDPNGHERIFELAFGGAWLGTAAVTAGDASPVTAIACTRAVVGRLDAPAFQNLLTSRADLSAHIHRLHARALCRQAGWTAHLTTSSSRQRLEWVIRQLIAALGLRESVRGVRLQLPLRHWELAGLIAVTPEHFSRLLGEMQKEGIIRREKGWVIVQALDRLCTQFTADAVPWCESGMRDRGIVDGGCPDGSSAFDPHQERD